MNTSPWNIDRIIGQKRPLQISHVWGIRIRLELEGKVRDLALFNMALDSKLRGCVWLSQKFMMWPMGTLFQAERLCCSKKRAALFSLN